MHVTRIKIIAGALGICAVFGVLSCYKNPVDSSKLSEVKLVQEWTPNSNYCGAVFGATKFAARHGLKLTILPGSESVDPIKLVISGDSHFGDAAADKVVAANVKGANLVIVGVLNTDSPTCFLAKEDRNIRTPLDFAGKKVGVLTGTSTEYVYRALLAKLRIDKSQFTEIEAPFDLATFFADAYDVRPAFIYDEPVSLDEKNIRYTIINPRDYGVGFLGTVYFAKAELVRENPELVQKFIDTVADGWRATIRHPAAAIESLINAYPRESINASRELIALEKSIPYFTGYEDRPLSLNPNSWDSMISTLVQLGVLERSQAPPVPSLTFVANYYARNPHP